MHRSTYFDFIKNSDIIREVFLTIKRRGYLKIIPSKVTYLEMLNRSDLLTDSVAPNENFNISKSVNTPPELYRLLYNSVGENWQWNDRNLLSDQELNQILRDRKVEIYILHVDFKSAGYIELDRRMPGHVEIAYFGLVPEFTGKGWGKYFLAWVVKRAWSYNPNRVWVHTCDLDHPRALPNYLKAGFKIFKEETTGQPIL